VPEIAAFWFPRGTLDPAGGRGGGWHTGACARRRDGRPDSREPFSMQRRWRWAALRADALRTRRCAARRLASGTRTGGVGVATL